MPEISRFLGIVIAMFYRDHGPPHFHAVYSGYRITVEIETGQVGGTFPRRALALCARMAGASQIGTVRELATRKRAQANEQNTSVGVNMNYTLIDAKYGQELCSLGAFR